MFVITVQRKLRMYEDEGGWKWVVVIAAFFVQFIVCGITYTLGVFHVVFQDVFDANHFDTSWAGSILLYVTALTSVLFRFVTSKFGCRVSVMLGGLFACLGLSLSMCVTELWQVYLTYGLLTGVGFGLACTPSIVAVEKYCLHGRFQALSVVFGGIGAGIIAFPIIANFLLERFAWRGALLILAAISLNLCVCGSVMRPLKYEKEVQLMPLMSCLPFRSPLFHGMCIANLFWSFGSSVIYMYLPSYAIEMGSDFESSTFLISCLGISSFISRMIFAFMGHNSALDDVTAVLCSVGLGVVVTGISPLLFDDYAGQVGYTILFGFYSGYWTTFLSQVSRELVGPEYLALGNGYLSFMVAVGSLVGGPTSGLLIQEENQYKYVFYLAGSCLLWSSIIMVLFKYKGCSVIAKNYMSEKESRVPLIETEFISSKNFRADDEICIEAVVTNV